MLRNFGLKGGMVGATRFEARVKELIENFSDLAVLVEPLLVVRRVLPTRTSHHPEFPLVPRWSLAQRRNARRFDVSVDLGWRFDGSGVSSAMQGGNPNREPTRPNINA
jgi:hypothetical protein